MLDPLIVGCTVVLGVLLAVNAVVNGLQAYILRDQFKNINTVELAELVSDSVIDLNRYKRALVCAEVFIQYGAKAFGRAKEDEAGILLDIIRRIRNE